MPWSVMTVDTGRLLFRDLENNGEDDSPAAKKSKSKKFHPNSYKFTTAIAVFFLFATGLFSIYFTMPASKFGRIKLSRTLFDFRHLK